MGLALRQGARHSEPPIAAHYLDSVGKFLLPSMRLTLPICKVEGMNQRALLRVPFPVKLVSPINGFSVRGFRCIDGVCG